MKLYLKAEEIVIAEAVQLIARLGAFGVLSSNLGVTVGILKRGTLKSLTLETMVFFVSVVTNEGEMRNRVDIPARTIETGITDLVKAEEIVAVGISDVKVQSRLDNC